MERAAGEESEGGGGKKVCESSDTEEARIQRVLGVCAAEQEPHRSITLYSRILASTLHTHWWYSSKFL